VRSGGGVVDDAAARRLPLARRARNVHLLFFLLMMSGDLLGLAARLRPLLLDPTFMFAFNTIITIFFVTPHELTKTLDFGLPPLSLVLRSLVDPAVLLGLAICALGVHLTYDCPPLSRTEQYRANWYLWNGVFFHTIMDGMAGMGYFPLLSSFYEHLDNRFRTGKPFLLGGPHHSESAMVELVMFVELFVMVGSLLV